MNTNSENKVFIRGFLTGLERDEFFSLIDLPLNTSKIENYTAIYVLNYFSTLIEMEINTLNNVQLAYPKVHTQSCTQFDTFKRSKPSLFEWLLDKWIKI